MHIKERPFFAVRLSFSLPLPKQSQQQTFQRSQSRRWLVTPHYVRSYSDCDLSLQIFETRGLRRGNSLQEPETFREFFNIEPARPSSTPSPTSPFAVAPRKGGHPLLTPISELLSAGSDTEDNDNDDDSPTMREGEYEMKIIICM